MFLRRYHHQNHPAPCDLDLSTGVPCLTHTDFDTLVERIHEQDIRCYPDGQALEASYAQWAGVPAQWVVVTAGADDAIDRICRLTLQPGTQALWTTPGFSMYPRYVALCRSQLKAVAWDKGAFPLEAYIDAVCSEVQLLILVSPQNPTGAMISISDIEAVVSRFPDKVVLLDEAYVEFSSGSAMALVENYPNLVVTRTLSKALRGAGLRVGFAIGRPQMVEKIRAAGSPYPVAGPSLRLAQALLERPFEALCQEIKRQRDALHSLARELGGEIQPSQSNSVLWKSPRAAWIRDALAGLGISSRSFEMPALRHEVRITCPGTTDAMHRLESALRCALSPSLLLFDMDGVLFDVSGSYRACIIRTAKSFGLDLDTETIQAAKDRGNANDDWVLTWRLLLQAGIECTLAQITERFEYYYQDSPSTPGLWRQEIPLVDRNLLEQLGRKIPLGVVTGRPRVDAERSLAKHDIADCFEVLVCREDAPLKPCPDPIALAMKRARDKHVRAWYVGDTPDDIVAARSCGVLPIGHAPPHCDLDAVMGALFRAGASRVLFSLNPLLELLP